MVKWTRGISGIAAPNNCQRRRRFECGLRRVDFLNVMDGGAEVPALRFGCLGLACWVGAQFSSSSWGQADQKPPVVERARRPVFSPRDWDGIYFQNLFAEGLVGSRPEKFGKPATTPADSVAAPELPASAGGAWSSLITGAVIEDEIKALQGELDQAVTTPTKFKSENAKVRRVLTQLATLFAIIAEYDGDVRWKDTAVDARTAFARAAAAARTTTDAAYQTAKSQKENLNELIRGGKFAPPSGGEELAGWTSWANRSEVMDRLELGFTERLRPWTSSESEFQANLDQVVHEVSLIGALAQILTQTGMDDADDAAYTEHAQTMKAAAIELRKAALTPTYVGIAAAADRIGQACSNCHEAYR